MQVFFRQSCEYMYMQLFSCWKCIEFSSLLVPDGYLCPHFIQVVQVNIAIQNGLLHSSASVTTCALLDLASAVKPAVGQGFMWV